MVSTRDPLHIQGHIQTESEEMEKGTLCKCKLKDSQNSNILLRQKRLQNRQNKRDKEGHHTMIKASFPEGAITIVNKYLPNTEHPNNKANTNSH